MTIDENDANHGKTGERGVVRRELDKRLVRLRKESKDQKIRILLFRQKWLSWSLNDQKIFESNQTTVCTASSSAR